MDEKIKKMFNVMSNAAINLDSQLCFRQIICDLMTLVLGTPHFNQRKKIT